MPLIHAVMPAPWWTPLTYRHTEALAPGLRVAAPLGRGFRVGVTVDSASAFTDESKIKSIAELVDEAPVLPDELLRLALWFGETWFIGAGFALKNLLPAKFFTNEKIPPSPARGAAKASFSAHDVYDANLFTRYDRYVEMLENTDGPSLVLFPEVGMARAFWEALPPHLLDGGALWPASPSKQWKIWKEAQAGRLKFVAGSPGAAFLPMPGLAAIAVDEENQGSWRTQSHPCFNIRSLLGTRAALAGAKFFLGGAMPSSKGFLRAEPECPQSKNESRLVFVSLKEAAASEFDALRDTLPISEPLVRETAAARRAGRWALWLLDRKGYAGEIVCDECGGSVRCARCGSSMRWERGVLRCLSCGERVRLPEKCPNCGGRLLQGVRPGLEALHERAEGALKYKFKNVLLLQKNDGEIPEAQKLKEDYPDGALIVGTRRLLSLCDGLSPAVVGWIDADAEARQPEYDAKAKAFALLWESMWRGTDALERRLVIQSRRPGKGWQEALSRGWGLFWRRELKERREWELPPYTPMLKVTMPKIYGPSFVETLQNRDFEYWISEEKDNEIWIRTKRFHELAEILKPFFDIKGTRKGFPTVLLYLD